MKKMTSSGVHRFAVVTSTFAFLLIVVGAFVTSTGSGMAVPDWPTSFGYNMFLFPISKMAGGIFYEHSHRLLGAFVGILTTILAFWLWLTNRRRLLRGLGLLALGGVIAQGLLGGLRVTLVNENLAIIHAAFAQAFFALTVILALFTSPSWQEGKNTSHPTSSIQNPASNIRILSLLTTILIFLQLIFGAVLRHTGTRLDAHLSLAFMVTIFIVMIALRIFRNHLDNPILMRHASILLGLLVFQLSLGLASLFSTKAQVILTTVHVATGALLLSSSLILTLQSYRFLNQVQKSLHPSFVLQEAQS
ncbi:COX15/CtaA family protein [candidate division TA06 bacterium]|nr:COX15/CtaA family protein [candidate division TA06 bacterium]